MSTVKRTRLRDDLADERAKRVSFEKFVRDELRHLREQSKLTNEALEWLIKAAKEDEVRDEHEEKSHV